MLAVVVVTMCSRGSRAVHSCLCAVLVLSRGPGGNIPGDLGLAARRQCSSPTTRPPLGRSRRCHCQTQLLRATLGSASYAPISSRLNNNGYKGLRYTGRPDKMGASLGLSGDGSAEAAPGMAAILASRGPLGPTLAFQIAVGVILASWFPIQAELGTPLSHLHTQH